MRDVITRSEMLDRLVDAALEGGRAIEAARTGALKIRQKADTSPVTSADVASEIAIEECLSRAAPNIPIVSEEQADGHSGAPGPTFFLVDPLDGTREFVAGRPDFTVNIALISEGRPVVGVVLAPDRRALYAGDVESGWACHWTTSDELTIERSQCRQIRVRPVPSSGLVAVASNSHRTPQTEQYLAGLPLDGTVSVGSSLKFCLVADGQADIYPRLGTTMEWDTAAGQSVLTAAGGRVLTIEGSELTYGKPGFRNPWFVASSGWFPPGPGAI